MALSSEDRQYFDQRFDRVDHRIGAVHERINRLPCADHKERLARVETRQHDVVGWREEHDRGHRSWNLKLTMVVIAALLSGLVALAVAAIK